MAEKAKRVVCYGDSNTWGYDPTSLWGDPYPDGVPWPSQLACHGFEAVNEGLNGRCVPDDPVSWQRTADMLEEDLPAGAIVVMLGTNDLLRGVQCGLRAEDVAGRMRDFLESKPIRRLQREAPVILVAPPRMRRGALTDLPGLLEESRCLGAEYGRLARELGVGFCDASAWDLPMAYDGTHLTPQGHELLAQGLAKVLSALS